MERCNTNSIECEDHELLNNNMHKKTLRFLRSWCDNRLKDMWFIVNIDWFNPNVKSLNNVKLEIKNQTLNIF